MANAICLWFVAHGTSCLEMLCVVTGIPYVVLAMRQNIWAWPVGLANAVVCALVLLHMGLYSDTGLQGYYFATSLYGWFHWLRGGQNKTMLSVTHVGRREAALLAGVGVIAWAAMGVTTARLPGATIPYADALPVTLSLAAQWMTARKQLENWAVWIAANTVYVAIYAYKHLFFLAGLSAIYLVLAVLGHLEWKRDIDHRSPALS